MTCVHKDRDNTNVREWLAKDVEEGAGGKFRKEGSLEQVVVDNKRLRRELKVTLSFSRTSVDKVVVLF